MIAALDVDLPRSLDAGVAGVVFLHGTCAAEEEIVALEVEVAGVRHPVDAFGMPRGRGEPRDGFWATVPVVAPAGMAEVALHARLAGGGTACAPVGAIEVRERPRAVPEGDLIAVCMATFEPDPELFAAQIESLRSQTDTRWTCVISDDGSRPEHLAAMRAVLGDDPRFRLVAHAERAGFYRNFERALRLAPPAAPLIALADQDDRWHPDKLATLRAALGDAKLAYSDQRLVDPAGRVVSETLWRGRRNNRADIVSMLVANSVTGAAALFRREVAELALPFPETPGMAFHDHWIALAALAAGELAYVDRPLYDYVQHPQAVLGAAREPEPPALRRWLGALRSGSGGFFRGYLPRAMMAGTLLLRGGGALAPSKRVQLERFLAAERSWPALAWLVLGIPRRRPQTLGGEGRLVWGIVWRRLLARHADTRLPGLLAFQQWGLRRWRSRT